MIICLVLLLLALFPRGSKLAGVRVGSKKFTESVILGEMLTQLIRSTGQRASHLSELGGTTLVFDALRRGEIDLYPEYTGTLIEEIFSGKNAKTFEDLSVLLEQQGVFVSQPLGFNNSYALAVTRDTAEQYKLTTISDLAAHDDLRMGFSNEFLDRDDGWKNLRKRYGLPQDEVTGLDHDLAYRQLESGTIEVMDVYTTDARLEGLDLVLLEDNRNYFPRYDAVVLFRSDLAKRFPDVPKQIARLEGMITAEEILDLNAEVETGTVREPQAAADFLREQFSLDVEVADPSVASQIWQRTLEHCDLVRRSLIPAIFAAIPLGILAAKRPRLGQVILGVVGIVQTIPALALLVLLIAPVAYLGLDTLGAGSATAIVALFLYSLLPIVRNTATGLTSISPEYAESATALGLSPMFRLLHIELPLASPSILAGIKTAAILNVGFATLGALVGARGYGQPILTGIRLNDMGLIMQGAIPAACMAILLQILFEVGERWFVPAGLLPQSTSITDVEPI
ncbi:glycine betaine ABC transporter substrate-binding protein [Bythopirellula polymerisocia]|nr:glycine betaine ABC transporter substrate-binding protein [Bythopirellula polymerisocia]